MFIDQLEIDVFSGAGGHGAVSFRREKYAPFGGPDGGNGGHGGSVWIKVNPALNTLLPLRNLRRYRAPDGKRGGPSNQTGASGEDLILYVPRGTLIRDKLTQTLLADLTGPEDAVEIAVGGRGGKGNAHFTTSTHQAPRFAQDGQPGEERQLALELKMMADVGLVGFPNAGKSTLVRCLSAARPKVADYPFTTLEPSLGVVQADTFDGFVMADIPGIIEGASEGAGLGLRFIKHIERTGILLFLIDPLDPTTPVTEAYRILDGELTKFNARLARKKRFVAFTKCDLIWGEEAESVKQLTAQLESAGVEVFEISAMKKTNTARLVQRLFEVVKSERGTWHLPEPEEAEPAEHLHSDDPLDELT